MNTPSTIHSAVPVIGTDDIRQSIRYYVSTLGFELDYVYGDPPVYAGVKAGEVEIYFSHSPEFSKLIREKEVNPEIFIWVPDADSLFRKHVNNGAEVFEPIADRPWGARQYVIRDVNGYHLKFAQPL
jgi:uncharacterized glyoxalase superfamily protein PhnB